MWQGEGVTVHTARLDGFVTIIHPPVSSLSFVEHNFCTTILFFPFLPGWQILSVFFGACSVPAIEGPQLRDPQACWRQDGARLLAAHPVGRYGHLVAAQDNALGTYCTSGWGVAQLSWQGRWLQVLIQSAS